MIGFSIPLRWPEAGDQLRTMERQVLEMARMMNATPRAMDDALGADGRQVRAQFARSLREHWPEGPSQPPVVAQLAARYPSDGTGGPSDADR